MKQTHYLKKALPAFIGLAVATGAHGACGFFGNNVLISTNGTDVWQSVSSLEGADLGDFGPGAAGQTLEIKGAEGLTWRDDASNVTGVTFHYSIKKAGEDHAFTNGALTWTSNHPFNDAYNTPAGNGNDQKWANSSSWAPLNVLAGLTAGEYELQVYMSGQTNTDPEFFENDGGNNYTANFTVVPEPSSAALLGLGGLALTLRRRK